MSAIARHAARAAADRDRGGDPLDGLVNLFDLGIVLAVAFLLAALSSLKLTELLTTSDVTVVRERRGGQTVIVKRGDDGPARSAQTGRAGGRPRAARRHRSTGSPDGRLVYVEGEPMNFIWDGIRQAFDLLDARRPRLLDRRRLTLRVALWSTLLALAIGLPLGLALGPRRASAGGAPGSRSPTPGWACRRSSSGLVVALLLFRQAPLGGLDLIYTLNGVIARADAARAPARGRADRGRGAGACRPGCSTRRARSARRGCRSRCSRCARRASACSPRRSRRSGSALSRGRRRGARRRQHRRRDADARERGARRRSRPATTGGRSRSGLILLGLILVLAAVLTVAQQRAARALALRRAS